MPEELSAPQQATHANNLHVAIAASVGKITCQWEIGYLDGEGDLVVTGRDRYVFEGRTYDALAEGHNFQEFRTNYENIRELMYATLRRVGKI